jgi:hypothetical protein
LNRQQVKAIDRSRRDGKEALSRDSAEWLLIHGNFNLHTVASQAERSVDKSLDKLGASGAQACKNRGKALGQAVENQVDSTGKTLDKPVKSRGQVGDKRGISRG